MYTVIEGKIKLVKDFSIFKNEIIDITKGNAIGNYDSNRFYILGEILKILPNNLCKIDCFLCYHYISKYFFRILFLYDI